MAEALTYRSGQQYIAVRLSLAAARFLGADNPKSNSNTTTNIMDNNPSIPSSMDNSDRDTCVPTSTVQKALRAILESWHRDEHIFLSDLVHEEDETNSTSTGLTDWSMSKIADTHQLPLTEALVRWASRCRVLWSSLLTI